MELTKNLPRRDLVSIVLSLTAITVLCWIYLIKMAQGMSMHANMPAMQIPVWDSAYFLMMFLMWSIMMIGMMLPSATPMILIYAGIAKKSAREGKTLAPVGSFVSGYIAIWIFFSLLATIAQWGLDEAALLSPMMVSKSAGLGAGILIVAGIYQWLPIKDRCLDQCRTPVNFISTHWQSGTFGAFKMGLSHGLFCLGCCWVLMCLLFVGGVMNLLWIAAITVFVLLEKILPLGAKGGRLTGIMMIGAGFTLFFSNL